MQVIHPLFTKEQLLELQFLPEVLAAHDTLQGQTSVSFTAPVNAEIRQILSEAFQIDFTNVAQIPFRWIRGDTAPHVDRGYTDFERTYLVYLTDGEGEFRLGDQSYPIEAGTSFSFPEGLTHEVVGAGDSTRLLLGPMSEQGFAVGITQGLVLNPGETGYIREEAGVIQFSYDQVDWFSFDQTKAIYLSNTRPSEGDVFVEFVSNITINDANCSFYCSTNHIQIGSKSLRSDGTCPTITIDGVTEYPGVFFNGGFLVTGKEYIYIYNLQVDTANSSTLIDGGGWIGQSFFGQAATNNYIVNCSSSGGISLRGGGIVGQYAGAGAGASLVIRGCSSSGSIGIEAGGIAGKYAGSDSGSITGDQCWSLGNMDDYAGGIYGKEAANGDTSAGQAIATKCYSLGEIAGAGAGGIFGQLAGTSASTTADTCYSRGAVSGTNAGGIYGSGAASDGGVTNAIRCYSSGIVFTPDCGMYGGGVAFGRNVLSCYIADGNWSDIAANAVFGSPDVPNPVVGDVWVSRGINQPYELNNIGYTPYTLVIIDGSSELVGAYSQTVQVGQTTVAAAVADASGNSFELLQTKGGDPGSYTTLSISAQTGVISTTSDTAIGTYTIYVRSLGSYNITRFLLTVTGIPSPVAPTEESSGTCCRSTMDVRGLDYQQLNDYRIGNRLLVEKAENNKMKYDGYSQYVKMKMAQNQR